MSDVMSDSQAQALYAESRERLSERMQATVTYAGSLARQVVRGSKCCETMGQAFRVTASFDNTIEATENNLRGGENLTNQMKMCLMQMRIIEVDGTDRRLDRCLQKYGLDDRSVIPTDSTPPLT